MNIRLENIDLKDVCKIAKWKADPILANQIMSVLQKPNITLTSKWIKDNSTDAFQMFKGIYNSDQGRLELLGVARLMYIDYESSNAELGIYIGDSNYQNKGIGRKALDITLKTGFIDLKLNKIYLRVSTENLRAIKLYQNKGFVVEGCLKEHFFNGTQYEDVLKMALFKEDYK